MQTIRSSQYLLKRSSQKTRSLLRKPMIPVVRLPASLKARSCGKIGATPRPPPTRTTCPTFPTWLSSPSGPTKSEKESPSLKSRIISFVVLPRAWMTMVTVPHSGS